MTNDMLRWVQTSYGVGGIRGADLLGEAQVRPPVPPREKKVRHRPNNGRKKRTNRTPPLPEPPWEMLLATGYPIPRDIRCLSYVPTNWRRGTEYRVWRRRVHEMWGYRCHLCGHPNAHTADHLVPLSVWSNQPYDARLSRPAHGVEGCDTCGIKCNSSRGNRQLAIEIGHYTPPVVL
jgi:hypothetical protein